MVIGVQGVGDLVWLVLVALRLDGWIALRAYCCLNLGICF